MTSTSFATTALGRVFREESGRVVAALITFEEASLVALGERSASTRMGDRCPWR